MGDTPDPGTTTGTDTAAMTAAVPALQRTLATAVSGVTQLRADVSAGRLVLDPDTGQQLQQALSDHIDQVSSWKQRATNLGSPLPMGQNWVGQGMAQKFAGRASGSDASLASVLDQYHSALTGANDAVAQSMANYQESETGIGTVMKQLDSRDVTPVNREISGGTGRSAV